MAFRLLRDLKGKAALTALSGSRNPRGAETAPVDVEGRRHDKPSANKPYVDPVVLDARCWCGKAVVSVPTSLIKRAQTLSCGRQGCSH